LEIRDPRRTGKTREIPQILKHVNREPLTVNRLELKTRPTLTLSPSVRAKTIDMRFGKQSDVLLEGSRICMPGEGMDMRLWRVKH
jgi:hypothetical protein